MGGEHTAFFYGTLMAPEVFFSVCHGVQNPLQEVKDRYTFEPAILHNYCRHRVQYADYPAVVPEKDCSVKGVFVTGVTAADIENLDWFEGSEYDRVNVEVKLLVKQEDEVVEGESKKTTTYVFNKPYFLERGEWDFEHFRNEKMRIWTRGNWTFDQDPNDTAIVKSAD